VGQGQGYVRLLFIPARAESDASKTAAYPVCGILAGRAAPDVGGNCDSVTAITHGWEASDGILCNLLPTIADRSHIVACHDVSDSRHVEVDRSYGERIFWRGPELKDISARYNIGWINTQEPQFLPLTDFLWRNRCALHSADEDLAIWRQTHSERQKVIERDIGLGVISPGCHWAYFSLNEAEGDLTFPALPEKSIGVAVQDRVTDGEITASRAPPLHLAGSVFWRQLNRVLDRLFGVQIVRSNS
jgi:hypothetical protein